MPHDAPSEALRLMLVRRDLMHKAACFLKTRKGWRGSDDDAHTRLLQKFGEYGGPHQGLWLDDAYALIEFAGEDPCSERFSEAARRGEAAALRRRLDELERPGVRPVRRGRGAIRETG